MANNILPNEDSYFQIKTTVQRCPMHLLFPFLKFICGIRDLDLANSFWAHVIQISIRQIDRHDPNTAVWLGGEEVKRQKIKYIGHVASPHWELAI